MKKLIKLMLVTTALMPILFKTAKAEKLEGVEVSKTAQGINFTQAISVGKWDRFSAQAVYSDGTPSTFSFVSGTKASATMTVGSNPSGLIGAQASMTVNVKSTSSISGKSVTLNGTVFTAGTDFTIGTTTSATATNLAAKIDADPALAATVSGATVTVKFQSYGTSGNGATAVTSSATNFGLSAATFTGGVNQYSFFINGYEFKEGTNWHGNSSSQTIAIEISTSIIADTRVNTSVTASTTSLGIVTITALQPGFVNYNLAASTTGLVTSSGFPGGLASDVDPSTDIFTKVNHGLTTGLQVLVATTSLAPPTGLTTQTTYFAIKLNENQYKLATSSTLAAAGTAIDITGITNSATMDMKPLSLVAGSAGFLWKASNDGTNFTTLDVSSVTYSAGNSVWDFGEYAYKYLQIVFTGPTSGGINLSVRIFGRKDQP